MKTKWKITAILVAAMAFGGYGQLRSVINDFVQPSADAAGVAGGGSGAAQIEYAFTQEQQHPEKLLNGVINGAKKSLDISIYSLTEKSIVASILKAKERGVAVRIITDAQQSEGKSQAEALKQIRKAGIPVKINSHSGLMHEKVTVADKSIVTTGSFNYSSSAATKNDEVLVVIHDATMAKNWDSEFETMWDDTSRFKNYLGD